MSDTFSNDWIWALGEVDPAAETLEVWRRQPRFHGMAWLTFAVFWTFCSLLLLTETLLLGGAFLVIGLLTLRHAIGNLGRQQSLTITADGVLCREKGWLVPEKARAWPLEDFGCLVMRHEDELQGDDITTFRYQFIELMHKNGETMLPLLIRQEYASPRKELTALAKRLRLPAFTTPDGRKDTMEPFELA